MSKYPKVNFIGNKEKVASWIINSLPIKSGKVIDLFSGGCSVSHELKKCGFNVIANDGLYSNFVIAKAIIENSSETLKIEEFDLNNQVSDSELKDIYSKLNFLSNNVYHDYEVLELSRLVAISYKLRGYKKYLFLALLRRAMIRKIPYSRMNIKWSEILKLRDENYSYKKYGRYRHYHNAHFLDHIKDNLNDYNNAVIDGPNQCLATNYDVLDFFSNIDEKVDLVYLDPPYPSTMNNYQSFYGQFDKMFNIEPKFKIDLTNKNLFLTNFEKIIRSIVGRAKYVAISLNNNSYPDAEKLIDKIIKYIYSYEIKSKAHSYKITGKKNKNSNFEILIICLLREEL